MNFPAASFVWFFVPFWRVLPVEILVFVRGDPPLQRGGPPAAATSRGLALSRHLAHPTLERDSTKASEKQLQHQSLHRDRMLTSLTPFQDDSVCQPNGPERPPTRSERILSASHGRWTLGGDVVRAHQRPT